MVEVETVEGLSEGDILDSIMDRRGHMARPAGAITVQDYIDRARDRGLEGVSTSVALAALREGVRAGELQCQKMKLDGRQRWVFWPVNGQSGQEV